MKKTKRFRGIEEQAETVLRSQAYASMWGSTPALDSEDQLSEILSEQELIALVEEVMVKDPYFKKLSFSIVEVEAYGRSIIALWEAGEELGGVVIIEHP